MAAYVFRDFEPLWLVLILVALVTPFLVRRSRLSASALALTWGSSIAIVALLEVRFVQILFAGIALSLAVLAERAWVHPARLAFTRVRQGLIAASLAAVLFLTAYQGQQVFYQASTYYRVIGNDLLPGLDWLRSHTAPTDHIAVSRTQPDLLGWWIEGYARRPALYAANLRWLSFSQERKNATLANQIFDSQSTPEQIVSIIKQEQIHYLFIDQKYSKGALRALVERGVLAAVYTDQRVVIFKVIFTNN
jgi:hypothetical protein